MKIHSSWGEYGDKLGANMEKGISKGYKTRQFLTTGKTKSCASNHNIHTKWLSCE